MEPSRPPGCENCTEECTIHLTQIINNKIKKIDMCESCPNAKSIQDPNQFDLLSDLISKPSDDDDYGEAPVAAACENCGYTEEKLRQTGRLGCAQCYDTFSDTIDSMLSNMHKGSTHLGKVPTTHQKNSLRRRLTDLEKKLKSFIENERYEEAAEIRDQIQALKEEVE